jgi:hypothetical protein
MMAASMGMGDLVTAMNHMDEMRLLSTFRGACA